jgi:hypothetical protein
MHYTIRHISFREIAAILVLILITWFYLTCNLSCTKDEPRLMKVLNDSVADISVATAKVYATVVDIGEGIDQ